MNYFPVSASVKPGKPEESFGAKKISVSRDSSFQQTLLLGVGLAFAVMALIAVLVAIVYTVVRPGVDAPVRLKAMENGKNIIVVDQ